MTGCRIDCRTLPICDEQLNQDIFGEWSSLTHSKRAVQCSFCTFAPLQLCSGNDSSWAAIKLLQCKLALVTEAARHGQVDTLHVGEASRAMACTPSCKWARKHTIIS